MVISMGIVQRHPAQQALPIITFTLEQLLLLQRFTVVYSGPIHQSTEVVGWIQIHALQMAAAGQLPGVTQTGPLLHKLLRTTLMGTVNLTSSTSRQMVRER